MAIIKGRRFFVVNGPVDPGEGDSIEITVTFASAPSSVSSAFPKMKFNKTKAILMEFDDDSIGLLTAYEKLSNTFYTDGCGNNKNFSLGLALNARNNYNDELWAGGLFSNKVTFAQAIALKPLGLAIYNHSYYHEPTGNNPKPEKNWTFPDKNFTEMDAFILEMYGYKTNVLVVPTNYAGYQLLARDNNYLCGLSEGTFDGLTPYPSQFNALGSIANIPKQTYTAIKRTFSDNWTNAGAQWTALTNLVSGSNDFFNIGSHDIGDGTNFNSWIDSIKSQLGDTVLFQSMQEFMEYKHLKEYVTKTESINGNSVKITLDYSTVPNKNISWYDLSLLLTSDKAITNVSINRSDFALSYNTTTKLINVIKRKTTWA